MVNRFTKKAQIILNTAKGCAEKMGHSYIGSEHLLLGILSTECVGCRILEEKKIFYKDIYDKIKELNDVGTFSPLHSCELTPRAKRIIESSQSVAKKFNSRLIGSEHILYALCEGNDTVGGKILSSLGVNLQILKNEIATFLDVYSSEEKHTTKASHLPNLTLYGKNLNLLAKEGKFDPLIGRDEELLRLIQILSRRTKNNPCLIGEPGVGKTAIVEGLAMKINEGDVPSGLLNKTIFSLELSSMIAGAKYRGEFEERMRGVLNEAKNNDSIILFIDEIHTIIGAGSAEGALDAANIIKPTLARGEIQVIGASTIEEYRRHIEKDSALERRFQAITVNEPTAERATEILFGLRSRYEGFHKVKITDEAIRSAVSLSVRYIPDRFLPDKAIDLIDEACSYVKMSSSSKSPKLLELERKINELSLAKENAIIGENFELASKIKDDELSYKLEYTKRRAEFENTLSKAEYVVDSEEIARSVTEWTHIPVSRLENEEALRLLNLEKRLSELVIGQKEAISVVSSCIRRGRVGLKSPSRPIGSFLFLGPTGVGKTLLAKTLGEVVFGSKESIVRLDMSEYMEKHSISRLIGSPPGYVGYDEGGQLTKAVKKCPYCVVLFDEIEKAHSDIYNILLQILEDGSLTDSQGRSISFKNTIIILTSNIGAKSIIEPKKLGFGESPSSLDESKGMKAKINDSLKLEFHPELLNRLDEIVVFNKLTPEDTKEVCRLILNEVSSLAEGCGIFLTFNEDVIDFITKKGFDKAYGARPLRRIIREYIENPLSEKILEGVVEKNSKVLLYYESEAIKFQINKASDLE